MTSLISEGEGKVNQLSLERRNVIDLSGSSSDQIAKWFHLDKVMVFKASSENIAMIDLQNIGHKELKDIVRRLRKRRSLKASKVSLLIRLEDLSYRSAIHYFIRNNRLEDLYLVMNPEGETVFDDQFWQDFTTFSLLTQSVRRYVLVSETIDPQIIEKMRLIFIEHEASKIKDLKRAIRSLYISLDQEKQQVIQDGLSYLRSKNNFPDSYIFTDEQLRDLQKRQKKFNDDITEINDLAKDIKLGLAMLRKEIALKKLQLSYDYRFRDVVKKYDEIPEIELSLPYLELPLNYSSYTNKVESIEAEQKELQEFFELLHSFHISSEAPFPIPEK